METSSSCEIEYSVATEGCDLEFSSWETKDGETPSCRASSRRDSPDSCRWCLSRAPRLTTGSAPDGTVLGHSSPFVLRGALTLEP